MPILAPRHPNSIDFFHWNDLINDQLFKLKNQAVTFACVKTFCLCERARVSYLFLILIYKLIGLLWKKFNGMFILLGTMMFIFIFNWLANECIMCMARNECQRIA